MAVSVAWGKMVAALGPRVYPPGARVAEPGGKGDEAEETPAPPTATDLGR